MGQWKGSLQLLFVGPNEVTTTVMLTWASDGVGSKGWNGMHSNKFLLLLPWLL